MSKNKVLNWIATSGPRLPSYPRLCGTTCAKVMPVDQSTQYTLDEWRRAERAGGSPGEFVRYLEYVRAIPQQHRQRVAYAACAIAWSTPI